MKAKFGVDVSEFQAEIDWHLASEHIDFAILRAGYGSNNIDEMFHRNAQECTKYGVPFGIYWFSYAYTEEMAKAEADFVCDLASKYTLTYPICYDFEYDSVRYASENGVEVDSKLLAKLATAFLSRVEERGYYAMLYANYDFLIRGFDHLIGTYDIWLAAWSSTEVEYYAGIWQYTSSTEVPGIYGFVDGDYCYKDYPKIIAEMSEPESPEPPKNHDEEVKKLCAEHINFYLQLAGEIILGKYGNGDNRKQAILAKGYDYDFVQRIVTVLLS